MRLRDYFLEKDKFGVVKKHRIVIALFVIIVLISIGCIIGSAYC